MDMKKLVGYVLSVLGLVGLAGSVLGEDKIFGKLSPGLADGLGISLLVLSLILLGVGVVILFVSGGMGQGKAKQKQREVPIYRGKEIVGYRRG